MNKRAIVNLSTRKFRKGQERLIKAIEGKTDADVFMFYKESQVSAPLHADNNYAFKVYAIEQILNKGYTQILWMDASMLPLKDLNPLFEIIDNEGHFMQFGGWKNNEWTNDRAREYFGTDEGEMILACCFGLNFENETTQEFFRLWKQSMLDGIFNGDWCDHRHDQACSSILAYKLGMKLHENHSIFQYAKEGNAPINDGILLFADGIV